MGRDKEVALYLLHPDPQRKPGLCARQDKAERSQKEAKTGDEFKASFFSSEVALTHPVFHKLGTQSRQPATFA